MQSTVVGQGSGRRKKSRTSDAAEKRYTSQVAHKRAAKPRSADSKGVSSKQENAVCTPVPATAAVKPIDPNEPLYCYCKRPSSGNMVGCENDDCKSGEWFHYECVGLTEAPTGKWYCPTCSEERLSKKRKRK